jgi:hypothetical protein
VARILFAAPYFSHYRNYDSVIRDLAARGHQLHLTADEPESMGGQALVERLSAEHPAQVTWGFAPSLTSWRWSPTASRLRRALEYVRFLDPTYDEMPKYRHRAHARAPRLLVWMFRVPGANTAPVRALAARLLLWMERAIPAPEPMSDFLSVQRPDIVLLAGVTNPGSPQLDHMKAAMVLGIRTGVTVWSWDHLSGKAWLRFAPDRIFVWNQTQREEALRLHGLPDERIVVTGAQCFDQWFDRAPVRSRDVFLRSHGLDPAQDLLLYVCSVLARPAPEERPFALEWVRQVREAADPRLRDANILIRPHPERLEEWQGVDAGSFERLAIVGANPIDRSSREQYYDSLYHSRAVMGLNTSAFLEAAVVGRPVFTVMKPEFRLFQMDTPHFRYLFEVAGGLLHAADDWPAHIAQLTDFFNDPAPARRRLDQFVEAFVRPNGAQVSATATFADAVEDMLGRPVRTAETVRPAGAAGRLAVRTLAALLLRPALRPLFQSAEELRHDALARARAFEEQAIKERKQRDTELREAANLREREEKLRQKAERRKEKAARAALVRPKRLSRVRDHKWF